MKLLRAIAITCFASFFAIIAYGQGEVVDLDKMELLAENCESDGEGACKDVLIDLMDQIAALAAQDSDVMEPMECPEVEQEEQSDGGADCNVQNTEIDDLKTRLRYMCRRSHSIFKSAKHMLPEDKRISITEHIEGFETTFDDDCWEFNLCLCIEQECDWAELVEGTGFGSRGLRGGRCACEANNLIWVAIQLIK